MPLCQDRNQYMWPKSQEEMGTSSRLWKAI